MPTKDDPRVTVRLSPELDRALSRAAIQARRGSKADVIRRTLEEKYLSGAVEQALGNPATDSGAGQGTPAGDRKAVGPAPAESSEEKYEPQWKTSLMTSGQRSNIGPRPKP